MSTNRETAEPLTPEEAWEAFFAEGVTTAGGEWCVSVEVVQAHRERIDAARAAQDVAGRETDCICFIGPTVAGYCPVHGGQPVTPPPDALRSVSVDEEPFRSMADAVHEAMRKAGIACGGTHLMGYATCQALALAALRAQGVVQGPELDVERLAEALWFADKGNEFSTLAEARDYAKEVKRGYESGAPS